MAYLMSSVMNEFNLFQPRIAIKRNQSIDLHYKLMDWFLYNCNTGLKGVNANLSLIVKVVY